MAASFKAKGRKWRSCVIHLTPADCAECTCFASTCQVFGYEDIFSPVKWLDVIVSEVTCNMLSGMLSPTVHIPPPCTLTIMQYLTHLAFNSPILHHIEVRIVDIKAFYTHKRSAMNSWQQLSCLSRDLSVSDHHIGVMLASKCNCGSTNQQQLSRMFA